MKRICFISETKRIGRPILDPSVRYRCFHPAEHLGRQGHFCSVMSSTKFHQHPNFDFDVYVFHRPNTLRPQFEEYIDVLKKSGKILIANYDDLIFGDAELARGSSAVKNETLSVEEAERTYQTNLDALQLFDRVITSTKPLAEMVERFNSKAQVLVSPNFLPDTILRTFGAIGCHKRARPQTTIGYFAGTLSHNSDFPIIEPVLHRILMERDDIRLLVVGPVSVPQSLASLPNVSLTGVRPFLKLPSLMMQCATAIAPLEDTLFNSCKSRVKFLEAALTGVRLVSSPIPDMEEIGEPNLVLARTRDEWYAALSNPVAGDDYRPQAVRNLDLISRQQDISAFETLGELN